MDSSFHIFDSEDDYRKHIVGDPKDTVFQIIISAVFGLGAFLAFCILRPRWPGLYGARKKQKNEAEALPELPGSLFGWIPTLWSITDEQVLASAGLDAFVFLNFFKMAIKYLVITLFFALVIIKPVHDRYPDDDQKPKKPRHDETLVFQNQKRGWDPINTMESLIPTSPYEADYLWMYLVFAYFFTGLALYLITSESRRIIQVRQEYLGSQTTITDRTIRLSGIPPDLRSEDKIKEFVEELEIGRVESVLLCKNWRELDKLMDQRMANLRRLEEAWTVYLGHRRVERSLETLPISQPPPPGPEVGDAEREDSALLGDGQNGNPAAPYARTRPTTRIWYGRLKIRYKIVDAIDYYEEKLRKLDERIRGLRKIDFEPCPIAFVTMDSVASCQMAVQAVLDSSPLQLLAKPSPAPSDVVWPNTYRPRNWRIFRSWSITAVITILTVFWSVILVPIAGLIDIDRIHKVWPALAEMLSSHPLAKSLVQTQLPTLVVSLLNVLVPYFYDWLSNLQGTISQGEIELSVISKNFFFTFFNFFIIFTALGTVAMTPDDLGSIPLRETANQLALSIQALRSFYVNYIILQGLGLFPFRLLEVGSVMLYPIGLIGAKTPRDYAELVQPPNFSYGFYLPQTLLIFLVCIVYSVLRSSWQILLPGLIYFIIGFYVYKYQLLYAMDHREHSTGWSWIMICDRIIVGLIIFQVTIAGQLALRAAIKRSLGIIPLVLITLWFHNVYSRNYKPLMRYIALRSIRKAEHGDPDAAARRYEYDTRNHQTLDESREAGLRFINPSLIAPLEDVWIADKSAHSHNSYSSSR